MCHNDHIDIVIIAHDAEKHHPDTKKSVFFLRGVSIMYKGDLL